MVNWTDSVNFLISNTASVEALRISSQEEREKGVENRKRWNNTDAYYARKKERKELGMSVAEYNAFCKARNNKLGKGRNR